MSGIGRREFVALLGGAVAAWPHVAHAQQQGRMRRIGVLMGWSEDSPEFHSWIDTFVQGLAQLGWLESRNVQMMFAGPVAILAGREFSRRR